MEHSEGFCQVRGVRIIVFFSHLFTRYYNVIVFLMKTQTWLFLILMDSHLKMGTSSQQNISFNLLYLAFGLRSWIWPTPIFSKAELPFFTKHVLLAYTIPK